MTERCKKCKVPARVHYAAGFDVWTCPKCGVSADNRNYYEYFEDVIEVIRRKK